MSRIEIMVDITLLLLTVIAIAIYSDAKRRKAKKDDEPPRGNRIW
jgi:hypothetical protein